MDVPCPSLLSLLKDSNESFMHSWARLCNTVVRSLLFHFLQCLVCKSPLDSTCVLEVWSHRRDMFFIMDNSTLLLELVQDCIDIMSVCWHLASIRVLLQLSEHMRLANLRSGRTAGRDLAKLKRLYGSSEFLEIQTKRPVMSIEIYFTTPGIH